MTYRCMHHGDYHNCEPSLCNPELKCPIHDIMKVLPEPDDEGNYDWYKSCNAVHEIHRIIKEIDIDEWK